MRIREIGQPGDLGWIVAAHGEQYATEFGWDTTFETLVARIVGRYAPGPRERGWVAELDGHRVGSVLCVPGDDDATAVLRVLLVRPQARGHGLGARLVATCVDFARASGHSRVRLWTVDTLAVARHVYLGAGFRLVAQQPYRGFGVEVVGQDYELDLTAVAV